MAAGGGFHHEAFFYADADELLAGTLPYLRAGMEAGEAIMVAMPGSSVELLKGGLGAEAELVRFVDMEGVGRNPARLISAWCDFVAESHRGGRVRGIGEPVWAGRSSAELEECRRHESLLNLAFADSPGLSLLCPYDVGSLSDEVLRAAEHSHPALSGRTRSADYAAIEAGEIFEGVLEGPTGSADEMSFDDSQLSEVRRYVARRAKGAGLGSRQRDDLVLAANEVATNSLLHGGGRGSLRIWPDAGALVCEFRDAGHFDEPLVGRRRPSRGQIGGWGLWLANQLCDLVQIRSDAGGSLVRLRMAIADGCS